MTHDVIPSGIYLGMAEDDYHAAPAMGSTSHRLVLRSAPDFWFHSWFNPGRPTDEDTETHAKIVGKAMHTCLLDGRGTYAARYAPTFHPGNIKEGKTERQIIAGDGKTPLKNEDYMRILMADGMIKANEPLANAFQGGVSEVSVFWQDSSGIPCKARLDYLKARATVDLKTIRNMREVDFVDACKRRIADYRYDIQAEHYREARSRMGALEIYGGTPEQRDLVRRCALSPEAAFVFVFYQGDGAPISWGCTLSPGNPILDVGRRSIDLARTRFLEYLARFGSERAWIIQEPLSELDQSELPPWWGRS